MAIMQTIVGQRVNLRCVEPADAGFTLAIRNDPELTAFIPRVKGDIEGQTAWIERQRSKPGDYFFVIERPEKQPVGTLAFYHVDLEGKSCEVGRYISRGSALENVEAAVLLLDAVYAGGSMETVVLNNDERNQKVIHFWKKFGAEFDALSQMDGWRAARYILRREKYRENRGKITALLKYRG